MVWHLYGQRNDSQVLGLVILSTSKKNCFHKDKFFIFLRPSTYFKYSYHFYYFIFLNHLSFKVTTANTIERIVTTQKRTAILLS